MCSDRIRRYHLEFDIDYTLQRINSAMSFNQESLDTLLFFRFNSTNKALFYIGKNQTVTTKCTTLF